mmetsp:Transcript_20370/g.29460  ORF Transcript_20370/g.29460 Transcript_20370/m.29460 type:complete len:605 (+) Transcript_20370:292-2106(+)|eukprot:CAMPEP_0202458956 /NCGR_PEP_ID=MMETSP1360-20130828/28701_1 /ASSEMBLY_ACC=CAM_ASM_000848 /TAXON_ID=515479 /ORGANISM="Licmophora paradoxa, Strain CCMP2313" /LENGTH=604 /DNA_ID=CAMNT_0049079725 /DNA_START=35 /DNA_END=1849 /DNA_ORIENTATION=-
MVQYKNICEELNEPRNRKYSLVVAILFVILGILGIVALVDNPFISTNDSAVGALGDSNQISPVISPVAPPVQDSMNQPATSNPSVEPSIGTPTAVVRTISPTIQTQQQPSQSPSNAVKDSSLRPTKRSTSLPSLYPTRSTQLPTASIPMSPTPTFSPTLYPTNHIPPSASPSTYPTTAIVDITSPTRTSPSPEAKLTFAPTNSMDIESDVEVTYRPGNLNNISEDGLIMSEGLTARMIARKNRFVAYDNNLGSSSLRFHERPDFGATFPDTRPTNMGGWVYVSNSEMEETGLGGVGAMTFDKDGNLIDYKMVLEGTTMNCGGGKTPWDTWISCEEVMSAGSEGGGGQIYEVDPLGVRTAENITMGRDGGRFESFTYDIRDMDKPRFFATEDRRRGPVRRFTPDDANWDDPWSILKGSGKLEFLLLNQSDESGGTFTWIEDKVTAQLDAPNTHPECEGIEAIDGRLYFVAKHIKVLFILDLDDMTYTRHSTTNGAFDGSPDQVSRILKSPDDDMLYFTEEGGSDAGVHGRNSAGQYFTILEGGDNWSDETTGLSFSPDGKHMYVAFQAHGALFDVSRLDGLPFHGATLNIKYHNTEGDWIQPSED